MNKSDSREDPNYLPDNLPECHRLITDLRGEIKELKATMAEEVKKLTARIAELEKQLSRRNRALFGKKSAKVDATLLTGTGKAIHIQTVNELDTEKDRLNIVPDKKHGGGRSAPSTLETTKIEHRIDPSQIPCPSCKQPREIIGFDVSHQIEFVRSLFEYIQHVMFKYACKSCNGEIITAQKPYQPIDKGLPGPGLLAKIATDKFWLHLPLYRQEQVFIALSIPISRSSMCRWLKEVADIFAPIVKRMHQLILKSCVIQSDATTLPVIKKGLGKTHRGYIWVYRGDAIYPYVFYDYSDTEHSFYPERILNGYTGILQTDGTNKFNEIIKNGAIAAACWAHVHCYFEDAWKDEPVEAEFPMGVIKSLFDIERLAITLPETERKDLRQRLAKPKTALLKDWLDEMKITQLPKTKLGEAISYTLNRWPALLVYLDHPFVEISKDVTSYCTSLVS